jgi:hypothetical protein
VQPVRQEAASIDELAADRARWKATLVEERHQLGARSRELTANRKKPLSSATPRCVDRGGNVRSGERADESQTNRIA